MHYPVIIIVIYKFHYLLLGFFTGKYTPYFCTLQQYLMCITALPPTTKRNGLLQ